MNVNMLYCAAFDALGDWLADALARTKRWQIKGNTLDLGTAHAPGAPDSLTT